MFDIFLSLQTRFNKRSQPSLLQDVPQIITRNASARNPVLELETSARKGAGGLVTTGRVWRSRRVPHHPETFLTTTTTENSSQEENGEMENNMETTYNGDNNSVPEQDTNNDECFSPAEKDRGRLDAVGRGTYYIVL